MGRAYLLRLGPPAPRNFFCFLAVARNAVNLRSPALSPYWRPKRISMREWVAASARCNLGAMLRLRADIVAVGAFPLSRMRACGKGVRWLVRGGAKRSPRPLYSSRRSYLGTSSERPGCVVLRPCPFSKLASCAMAAAAGAYGNLAVRAEGAVGPFGEIRFCATTADAAVRSDMRRLRAHCGQLRMPARVLRARARSLAAYRRGRFHLFSWRWRPSLHPWRNLAAGEQQNFDSWKRARRAPSRPRRSFCEGLRGRFFGR